MQHATRDSQQGFNRAELGGLSQLPDATAANNSQASTSFGWSVKPRQVELKEAGATEGFHAVFEAIWVTLEATVPNSKTAT